MVWPSCTRTVVSLRRVERTGKPVCKSNSVMLETSGATRTVISPLPPVKGRHRQLHANVNRLDAVLSLTRLVELCQNKPLRTDEKIRVLRH